MTRGKKTCKILKEIRRQIAEKNEIEYITAECHFQGECRGTCPKCEAELQYLENELFKRRQLGKAVAVAGISLGIASTFSACNNLSTSNKQLVDYDDNSAVPGEMEIVEGLIGNWDDTTMHNVYNVVEILPQFPGGDNALDKFLQENIVYPKKAREAGIEGRVFVNFVVRENGTISDITVQRSAHKMLSDEVIRVVKEMPRWIPGKQDGEPVNVYFSLPVNFELE